MQSITLKDADVILSEIKKATSILLHLHPSPDGDSAGSTLALAHALIGMGKKATVIKGDSNLPGHLSMLPGFNTIVEKNYFETDLSEFDLFIILDASALGQISRIKEVTFPPNLKTIVIDHHASNPGFADINLVEPAIPAACQILYELLTSWNVPITSEIAECLFVGIYTDTALKYPGTTARTYEIVAKLIEKAPNFTDLIAGIENSNTKGRLMLEALMLNSIEMHFSDSVAFASASFDEMQKKGIIDDDTHGSGTANTLVSVIGWEVGVTFIEQKPGVVKLSFRTRDSSRFDLSKVAVVLGGGGHKGAAGAEIRGTMAEAKEATLRALASSYSELTQPV